MKYTIAISPALLFELIDHDLSLSVEGRNQATVTLDFTCEPHLIVQCLISFLADKGIIAHADITPDDFFQIVEGGDFDFIPSFDLARALFNAFCSLGLADATSMDSARFTPLCHALRLGGDSCSPAL